MKQRLLWIMASMIMMMAGYGMKKSTDFVAVNGQNFEIDGKPYYFLGTNLWYACYLGADSEMGDRERLLKELDQLQALGVNNLRILGASEGNDNYRQPGTGLQPEPGRYNEELFVGMDFLLTEMHKRAMYAVIFLNNYWAWSGGMAKYVSWISGDTVPFPAKNPTLWPVFMTFSATFYANEKAVQANQDYIKMIIHRKNTISGVLYRDDPTIMAWQLANEPRPGGGAEAQRNFPAFKKWIDETAAFIKALDPNHLVCTGNEGLAGCVQSPELYEDIHLSPDIDYLTAHLWVVNWGWYNPLKPEQTYPIAEKNALAYIDHHIAAARKLNKPLVFEELGISRNRLSYDPADPTTWRDRYLRTIFEKVYQDAATGGPLAGTNFWAWGGYARIRDHQNFIWQEGDDFTGDPTDEPQGCNSVFVTDTTTLQVIAEFARKMTGLSRGD